MSLRSHSVTLKAAAFSDLLANFSRAHWNIECLHLLQAPPMGHLSDVEIAESRMRIVVGLKRYFHGKRVEGLLSPAVTPVSLTISHPPHCNASSSWSHNASATLAQKCCTFGRSPLRPKNSPHSDWNCLKHGKAGGNPWSTTVRNATYYLSQMPLLGRERNTHQTLHLDIGLFRKSSFMSIF